MASFGVNILATDMIISEAKEKGWTETNQHLSHINQLNNRDICPSSVFTELVKFKEVDMNNIPDDLKLYDFTWSSCAFEHLGSIEKGLQFVINSMKTLKPGEVAVHTTEFNISSNDKTIDNENTVLF